MNRERVDRYFNLVLVGLLVLLVVGIPLVFTSYTRSVFEVNKLLLVRIVTILVLGIALFRKILFRDNGVEGVAKNSIDLGGYRWTRVGLEIPTLLWVGLNILSTILSQNRYVSIIGAYDRWEGIVTILNYAILVYIFAKLLPSITYVHAIFAGIIGSSTISAIYGVFQSFGKDFMDWSVDPSLRVFACINNPVHFCAYMGMVVPIGIALQLYESAKAAEGKPWHPVIRWGLFLAISLIYYAQFLSFSRATWIGFIGAMTLMMMLVTRLFNDKTRFWLTLDFCVTAIGIAIFYLYAIFNMHHASHFLATAIFSGIAVVVVILFFFELEKMGGVAHHFTPGRVVWAATVVLACGSAFLVNWSQFPTPILLVGVVFSAALFIRVCVKIDPSMRGFMSRLLLFLIFAKLQFVSLNLTSMGMYLLLVWGFAHVGLAANTQLIRGKRFWITAYLLVFGLVIFLPTMKTQFSELLHHKETAGANVVENAQKRVASYGEVGIKGTAWTSMWKSALPWIKDHWWLGTGPDTVKFMYPAYRRPEYGILEGGHNFTPDRLHNEYINTLATRGVPAFIVYYGIYMVGWYILMIWGAFKHRHNDYFYLIAGLIAGVTVYLGQVMFNFGVVATLTLLYIQMGIGLAICQFDAEPVKIADE